jgi:hypothetical protein
MSVSSFIFFYLSLSLTAQHNGTGFESWQSRFLKTILRSFFVRVALPEALQQYSLGCLL